MSTAEVWAWAAAYTALFVGGGLWLVRKLRAPDEGRGCADGSLVGIVHSMDEGGSPISPGQSVFQKGTRVRLWEGNPYKVVDEGSVFQYAPAYFAVVVRWDSGVVTVEKTDRLEVIA